VPAMGDQDMCRRTIRVQAEDFSVAVEYQALRARLPAHAGAVATFVGLVRDLHGAGGEASSTPDAAASAPADAAAAGTPPDPVRALHLEHYPGMTERSIAAIAEQAEARWPLLDLLVIHRVGTLAPEAQIVFVQVASSHRAAAFAACEFVMDHLKTDAVFWKREDTSTGSHWVIATADDRDRVGDWRTGPVSG
jgi:molybdopterin synthase catalytic subunit